MAGSVFDTTAPAPTIEYSPISNKSDFHKIKEKIINGGKEKIFPFNMNVKNEKNVEMNQMKKQIFNTLQSYEPVEDLKKKKLFLNRESAKRSRLKKKQYIENLEKEFMFLKEEIIRLKNCKNNMEITNNSVSNNNIIKNSISFRLCVAASCPLSKSDICMLPPPISTMAAPPFIPFWKRSPFDAMAL